MKTDKEVGIECYSIFNHLQRLIELHIPVLDHETEIHTSENTYQFFTLAFFDNLHLAALENNFLNLLANCYYVSQDFDQFKRLTPFLCSTSHLLCNETLTPFHKVEDKKVIDFFMRFVANFSVEQNLAEFIQFEVVPFMHTFKLDNEKITHLLSQSQRSANQLLH